jgi:hypothetical protein
MKMKTLTDVLREADPVAAETRSSAQRAITRSAILDGPREMRVEVRPAPRWRTVAVAAVLAAIAIATGVFAWRYASVDAVAAMRFEARIEGSGEAIIDTHDILTADAVPQGDGFAIEVTLTREGAERLREATEAHIGEHLELLVDDEVVMAPVIRAAVSSPAMLTGHYTRADAERIADGLLKGKLEAQPRK